ncbi:hypothetical protein ACP275_09G072200 [Erythranthe tilingii]
MAAEVAAPPNCCRKKNLYASIYGSRKRAFRSKAPQNITVKKPKLDCAFIQSDDDEDDVSSKIIGSTTNKEYSGSMLNISGYQSIDIIGSGTYGVVHKARHSKTGEIVAIKQQFNGTSLSSFRETDVLESLLPHPSIVRLKEVLVGNDFDDDEEEEDPVYIVMEYFESDLNKYIKSKKKDESFIINQSEVKCLMKQLLEGVEFLHSNQLMHRDLKPGNILVNKDEKGILNLKICDFGMCRSFGSRSGLYTPSVGTSWYKSPEILLGAKKYSSAVDMWSVGCIMAELFTGQALFRGESELDQIKCVYRVLGTPNEEIWPGFTILPGSGANFGQLPCNLTRNEFPMLTRVGFDLLSKLLSYDPENRITAEVALRHAWFEED